MLNAQPWLFSRSASLKTISAKDLCKNIYIRTRKNTTTTDTNFLRLCCNSNHHVIPLLCSFVQHLCTTTSRFLLSLNYPSLHIRTKCLLALLHTFKLPGCSFVVVSLVFSATCVKCKEIHIYVKRDLIVEQNETKYPWGNCCPQANTEFTLPFASLGSHSRLLLDLAG